MNYQQHRRLLAELRRLERAEKDLWKHRAQETPNSKTRYLHARCERFVAYAIIQDIVRAT